MSTQVDHNAWSPFFFPTGQYSTFYGTQWLGQTVTPTIDYYLLQLDIHIYNYDLDLTIDVYVMGLDGSGNPDPTNILWQDDVNSKDSLLDMSLGTVPSSSPYTFYPNVDVTTAGYAIVVSAPAGSAANPAVWGWEGSGSYGGHHRSSDSGSTWTQPSSWEFAFTTYTPDEPGVAYDPTPETETSQPLETLNLTWTSPESVAGYTFEEKHFYFRESGGSWPGSPTLTISDETTNAVGIDVSLLAENTTYEWRVDYKWTEQTPVSEGDTWKFTVQYVELRGTGGGISAGSGNFPIGLNGTGAATSDAGTGAGLDSDNLSGSLSVVSPPTEINVTKTLYAISNNEFWYESTNNTMTELSAANGDMDVTLPLSSAPAFQKCFIANKSYLRVADFINIRLTSEIAIVANIPSHSDILTQAVTGATLVVDNIYYDTGTSDHYVYGRQTSTAAFDTTNNILDADSNVIITGANLSDATDAPHWYNWTEYNTGQVSTYDGMPDAAQLVCLYRGRLMLAGDPNDPYQWYMSRQANPWDWVYQDGDTQAAIAGGNGTMGKAGDIIKALIPWHDDYLILGCSRSMHVMRGDPAWGGSLDILDSTTGIVGPKAWCFDNIGNLYFYGTDGLYFCPREIFVNGTGGIVNLSKNAVPNL